MLDIFGLLLMSFASLTQNYNVKGKIADSNGQPMIGATIVLKGTTFGTATNTTGDYNLNANAKAGNHELEFCSVGYSSVTALNSVLTKKTDSWEIGADLSAFLGDKISISILN